MRSSHTTAHPQPGDESHGDTPRPTPVGDPPAELWRALTPLIAGRPLIRESTNGGRSYPAKNQRPLTERLPALPAAVPIYASDGTTRLLVADLDSSRPGGTPAVARDAAAITTLVTNAGGRVITDRSPNGGIHLYIPLQQPIGFHDARDITLALAATTPTMDPQPMLGLTDGLIRPPGSRHKTGGHQQLHDITIGRAYQVLRERNPHHVWQALKTTLADGITAIRDQRTAADRAAATGADAMFIDRGTGAPRELSVDYLRIATTGLYDTNRYPTPSEARQAVMAAAAWTGMRLADVIGRLERGTWPGLASLYARYRNPGHRRKALIRDWTSAVSWIQQQPPNDTDVRPVRYSPTSEPSTHRQPPARLLQQPSTQGSAAEYQFIRQWWTALHLLESRYTGKAAPAIRMVLRALGEAAMKTGSRHIEFGTRSLDLAAGVDHTTVAAHLRLLRSENEPLIDLIEDQRGLRGDLYQLVIPDTIADRARRMDFRAGKIQALRPAFRDLGLPAAFVYEALEHAKTAPSSFDLAGATGIARSTVYEALHTLAAYNLVEQRGGRWHIVATTSLAELAESLGSTQIIAARLEIHRRERTAYRRLLKVVTYLETAVDPAELAPRDDGETALELLERILGAKRLA